MRDIKQLENFLEKNKINFEFLVYKRKIYFYVSMDSPTVENKTIYISIDDKICCFLYKNISSFFNFLKSKGLSKESSIIINKINKLKKNEVSQLLEYSKIEFPILNLDRIFKNSGGLDFIIRKNLYSSVFLYICMFTEYFKFKDAKKFNSFHKNYYENFFDCYMFGESHTKKGLGDICLKKILKDKNFCNSINNIEEILIFIR